LRSTAKTSAIHPGIANSTAAEFPAAEKGRALLPDNITFVCVYALKEISMGHMSSCETLRQSAVVWNFLYE
jgi:hypothetical protein